MIECSLVNVRGKLDVDRYKSKASADLVDYMLYHNAGDSMYLTRYSFETSVIWVSYSMVCILNPD